MIEIKSFALMPDKEKLNFELAVLDEMVFNAAGTVYDNSAWQPRNFAYLLPCKDNFSFIIKENNELRGFSIGYTFSPNWFHISRFAIHPEAQGKGLARRLLAAQLRVMENAHPHLVTIDTKKVNQAALKLYESFKFVPLADRELQAYVQVRNRVAAEYLTPAATHLALIRRYQESFHLSIA